VATDEQTCRQISHSHLEPMTGTAPHAPAWLLVEHSTAWTPKAPQGIPWPDEVQAQLQARLDATGVRIGLIRRVPAERHLTRRGPTQVLLIHTGPQRPWQRTTRIGEPAQLLDLDLAGLAAGHEPDLEQLDGPVLAVCTHGSRDACCARAGRPVATALAQRFGAAVWETSHVGGHRFAANLVCFPHGLMYGRAAEDTGRRIAQDYLEGRVSLDHYRGRTCWPAPVQAAEQHLRAELCATGLDEVTVLGWTPGDPTQVDLRAAGTTHRLLVQTVPRPPARPFSCGSDKLEVPVDFAITEVRCQEAR
jgi:hypothetical protein